MWRQVFFWLAVAVAPLPADEILFGFRPVAPYVVVNPGGTLSGLEFEVIQAALAVRGHTVKPVTMPLARLIQSFRSGSLPAAAPILSRHNTGGVLTAPYLLYRNVAMTLEASGLRLHSPADLKGLSVAAFQTASTVLGPDYAAAVAGNPEYAEEAQQITQIRLLFSGRVQVIVGDSRILNQLIRSPDSGVDPRVRTVEHDLFAPTAYSVAFWDPGLAADFDFGLAKLRSNGTYKQILSRYP